MRNGPHGFSEAARLLRKDVGTVRRWANGYTYKVRIGKARGGPVLGGADAKDADWIPRAAKDG